MLTRLVPSALLLLAAAGVVFALDPRAAAPAPAAASPSATRSADTPDTVTVTATGTAFASPSYLSLPTTIRGNHEVVDAALENFDQARLQALGAFQDSGLAGVEVVPLGVELDYVPRVQADPNMGFVVSSRGQEMPDPGLTCMEAVEVRVQPAEDAAEQRTQIAHMIELAVDLELKLQSKYQVNPYNYNPSRAATAPCSVVGELTDEAEAVLERGAQAAALERAAELAGSLAELSGRALGPVRQVTLSGLTTNWKGVGRGMECQAVVQVTFVLAD